MATIEDFKAWMQRDIARFGRTDQHVEIVPSAEAGRHTIRIYTDLHRFTITARDPAMRKFPLGGVEPSQPAATIEEAMTAQAAAHKAMTEGPFEERMDDGYLGCTASCRKPRAGEDWTRGSDLHDGPLTEETWRGILGDIVSYEMVRVHNRAEAMAAAGRGIPCDGPPAAAPPPTLN